MMEIESIACRVKGKPSKVSVTFNSIAKYDGHFRIRVAAPENHPWSSSGGDIYSRLLGEERFVDEVLKRASLRREEKPSVGEILETFTSTDREKIGLTSVYRIVYSRFA
jgi:hypothetical protein